jgi:hypothetical protein
MGTIITASYTGFKSQTQRITLDTTEIILDFNVRDDTTPRLITEL